MHMRMQQCMCTACHDHDSQRMQPEHRQGAAGTRTLFRMTVRAVRKSFATSRSASELPNIQPLGR